MTVIHHLDCGTMCPRAAHRLGLVDRPHGRMVAHCLLLETADGLVLIDTGFGTADAADPARLGPARAIIGPCLEPGGTAVEQVRALGHDPADVRDILLTHLDLDHAGGLGDFPRARVHVHADELAGARRRPLDTRLRYRPAQWAHGPDWVEHRAGGERWFGFERVGVLDTGGTQIALIPLPGHTVGHSGFAVSTPGGWLLHCGDAYLDHVEVATPPVHARGRTLYHRLNAHDARARRENADRLGELARVHGDEVTLFCSHDPADLERLRAGDGTGAGSAA